MSDDDLAVKFRENAAPHLPRDAIDMLADRLLNLEQVDDVASLARLW